MMILANKFFVSYVPYIILHALHEEFYLILILDENFI